MEVWGGRLFPARGSPVGAALLTAATKASLVAAENWAEAKELLVTEKSTLQKRPVGAAAASCRPARPAPCCGSSLHLGARGL